jgi:hypothetical protein
MFSMMPSRTESRTRPTFQIPRSSLRASIPSRTVVVLQCDVFFSNAAGCIESFPWCRLGGVARPPKPTVSSVYVRQTARYTSISSRSESMRLWNLATTKRLLAAITLHWELLQTFLVMKEESIRVI